MLYDQSRSPMPKLESHQCQLIHSFAFHTAKTAPVTLPCYPTPNLYASSDLICIFDLHVVVDVPAGHQLLPDTAITILSYLVARPEVARVICIVRSRPRQSEHLLRRQIEAVERSRATILPHLQSKITPVEANQEANLVSRRLSLSDEDYKTLCSRVMHILHAVMGMTQGCGIFRVVTNWIYKLYTYIQVLNHILNQKDNILQL